MKSLGSSIVLLLIAGSMAAQSTDDKGHDWPQFRGPNASGIAPDDLPLPDKIGPNDNIVWKTPLPPGHSSPVVQGDRVFLTAVRDKQKLVTMALDRATGKPLWEKEARYKDLEKIHGIGSHAQATPAVDSDVVISFFGSIGLYAYDRDGKKLWFRPFGPFANDFGAGISPILVDDLVIFYQDHDQGSFLMAIDKKTGRTRWYADRSEFPRGYATPIIWGQAGKKQIVIAATLRAIGYDLTTGEELWTVRGLSRIVNMTPVIGPDGTLYIPAWTAGADPGDKIEPPSWDEFIKADKNGDGKIAEAELPAGPIKMRFNLIDRNKDNLIDRDEYDWMRAIFTSAKNRMIAVRPGGKGEITDTHVLWSQNDSKYLPYIPSPLIYKDTLFLVKNGGLLTSLDPKTGKPIKNERIFGSANYYASPVAGDGKVYTLSERGHLNVISAAGEWDVIHQAKFDEDGYATPAIAGGRIYLRTSGHLYCFGLPNKKQGDGK